MNKLTKAALAGMGIAALAVPGAQAAQGKSQHHGKAKQERVEAKQERVEAKQERAKAKQERARAKRERVKTATYILKGIYDADTTSVDVERGNNHARRGGLVGEVVVLDLSKARVSVADTNADGVMDVSDVKDGDRVVVQLRLRRLDPGEGPFAARKLVDRTHPRPSEHDETQHEAGEVETETEQHSSGGH